MMSGIPVAATLVALAVLVAPAGARHRFRRPRPIQRPTRRTASAVAMVAAVLAAFLLSPSAMLVGAILSTASFARVRRRRRALQRLDEGRAMAAALEVLVGELGVGAHPVAAFVVAAGESDGEVGEALRAVASRARLGADVTDGIRNAARTSAVPAYWNRLAVSWELAAQQGLSMAVLMRAAHRDIVDRQRFADRTHAALAGARATAGILAALPVLGVLLGQMIGAHPLRLLLGGGLGGALLIAGVILICAGVSWADHILDRLMA